MKRHLRRAGLDGATNRFERLISSSWSVRKTYLRRFRGEEEFGKGLGGAWEGYIITQELYNTQASNTKFLPIIFAAEDCAFIPGPLQGATHYRLLEQYDECSSGITNPNLRHQAPAWHDKANGSSSNAGFASSKSEAELFRISCPDVQSPRKRIRSGGEQMYNELIATNFISHSIASSCTVGELIEEIAEHSKKRIPIESIRAPLSTPGWTRGRVFFGNPGDCIEQILSVYPGAQWWVSKQGLISRTEIQTSNLPSTPPSELQSRQRTSWHGFVSKGAYLSPLASRATRFLVCQSLVMQRLSTVLQLRLDTRKSSYCRQRSQTTDSQR